MIPVELQPLTNHLWQSTLFAAVAGLLTLGFRKNRAHVRYCLWLTASVKFLIPFSLLTTVGSHFGRQPAAVRATAVIPAIIAHMDQSFSAPTPFAVTPTAQRSYENLWVAAFYIVWAIGFIIVDCSWVARWREVRAALRKASILDLPISVKTMSSPAFFEPGVFGIFRPVLLVPDGISSQLTAPQLQSLLSHELCHIRRHDNLATVIHMAVEATFWFHPLVWWLGARLMQERERACDEEVLRMGNEPQVYAESILRICELYIESRFQFVAGVTGGNLKRRIEEIMTGRTIFKLNFARKAILAIAGMTAVTIPILAGIVNSSAPSAQAPVPQWQIAAGGKMEFEVASIRRTPPGKFTPPNFPLDDGDAFTSTRTNEPPRGRFLADFPLTTYVEFAYKIFLTHEEKQAMLADLPKWVANDRFMIQAKAANDNPTKDQMRLMMQSLLADRFKLRVHFETRETPVFAVVLAKPGKTGPKLRPHSEGPACDAETAGADDVFPPKCDVQDFMMKPDHLLMAGSRNTTIDVLAASLSTLGHLGRPVIDQTGLSGRFDFALEWAPESNAAAPPNAGPPPDVQGPGFLQALREQLGFKLVSTKAPMQVLVIDHVERPTEN